MANKVTENVNQQLQFCELGFAFDLEGTSVDLEEHHHRGHLLALASFGIEIDRERAITELPHFIGGPDEAVGSDAFHFITAISRSFAPHIMDRIPLVESEFVADFVARSRAYYTAQFEQADIKPRDGLPEFLDWISDKGGRAAIGSLTEGEYGHRILDRSGLATRFGDLVVFREHVAQPKPAPDVYIQTAKAMRVSTSAQTVFEDSPRGIEAGKSAGSATIGMPVIHTTHSIQQLEASQPRAIFKCWRSPYLRPLLLNLAQEVTDASRFSKIVLPITQN